jgi:hypothetical protein
VTRASIATGTLVCCALLASASGVARAQDTSAPPPDPVDITPPSTPHVFGDGRGADLPWNDRDPALEPQPVGLAHFGLQLGGTVSSGSLGVPLGLELVPYLDLRITQSFQLRIGAVLGGQIDQGYGDPNVEDASGLGVWSGGGRLLVGLVGRGIAARLGLDLGAEYLGHSVDQVSLYAGGLLEIAFRLLDDERLELVFDVAVQDRSHSYRDPVRPILVIEDGAVVRGTIGIGVMF